MYRWLVGNLRLWSVISNVSSISNNTRTDTLNQQFSGYRYDKHICLYFQWQMMLMAYEAYKAYQSVNSGTNKELFRESLQQLVDSQFESAPNYEVIKKLNNVTGRFADIGVRLVQAFEADGKDMISTDDNVTIEFQDLDQEDIYIGDVYEFKGYRWIAVETKTVATLAKSCRVQRCNGVLKFVESTPLTDYIGATPLVGHIIEVDAFIDVKVGNVSNEQYKIIPHARMTVKVPYNTNTKKFKYDTKKGTRFILGDPASAWNIVNIDSVSGVKSNTSGVVTDGILILYLEQTPILPKDNLTDNVAWQLWF
jgi:hypothetical protein